MSEQRDLIIKLGQKITDRIGVKVTVDDPEYWGLAGVARIWPGQKNCCRK